MKKLLLGFSLIVFLSGVLTAQNITTSNVNTPVSGGVNDFILAGYATITNMTIDPMDIMCLRTSKNLANGHTSSFCWNLCFDTLTNLCTAPINVPAGGSTNAFVSDLWINNVVGVSSVSYRFYNQNNVADSASITIVYDVTTGINDIAGSKSSLSLMHPNPANKYTTLTYALKSNPEHYKIEILNMLGAKVAEYSFSNKMGLFIIPTENLQSGMYFCALKENAKTVSSQKLIVSHK